jgi:hypothetical protein
MGYRIRNAHWKRILSAKRKINVGSTSSNDMPACVEQILSSIRQKLSALASIDLGYPLGDNSVRAASATDHDAALLDRGIPDFEGLDAFYRFCDGLNLPDIGNGVFIHNQDLIRTRTQRGLPTTLRKGGPILVLGSDGGGGLFAMPMEGERRVLYLPVGAVVNGEFDNLRYPIKVVATSFVSFLERILADIEAFIQRRPGWRYIS